MVQYRNLLDREINRDMFRQFIRRQVVGNCYRWEKDHWEIREDPFIDDWSEDDYQVLIRCLKNTVSTGGFVQGAFRDGVLKGFASVEAEFLDEERRYLDLSSIHVSSDARRMGIGKRLFLGAVQWARKNGAEKLYISAHSAVESQAFYRSLGCVDALWRCEAHVEQEPYDCQLEYVISMLKGNPAAEGIVLKMDPPAEGIVLKMDPPAEGTVLKMDPPAEDASLKMDPPAEDAGLKMNPPAEGTRLEGKPGAWILEGCVDSVESAVTAWEAGAGRLELCANLMIGGTTPSLAAFRQVKRLCRVPVHVLIRPRPGDFCYTKQEFALIREEISIFRKEGADGIVIGILKPDGRLDLERMKLLMEDAQGMSVTLHRAFDVCADPYEALEQAAALGIHTILTSGGRANCIEGIQCLGKLMSQADGQIRIMAGGGVDASVIPRLFWEAGIRDFHMSGKMICQSPMTYRKGDVHMGAEGFGEYELWRADGERFREAARILDQQSKQDREQKGR